MDARIIKIQNDNRREKLEAAILFSNPELIVAECGNRKLIATLDLFNNHIEWSVYYNEYYAHFNGNWDKIINFFLGENNEEVINLLNFSLLDNISK